MAVKKSQLYSMLWESCNALRGSMDASQYKDYVLMILFVKYLSDKAGAPGMFIKVPEGCFFKDFVALKQNPHIGEEINKRLEKIKERNPHVLNSLTLPNFNDSAKFGPQKEQVATLSKLIGVFEADDLDFSKNHADDDDLLGDAYEYLMKNFAAESGKSKGQFYTPAEVSRVIAKILRLDQSVKASDSIYDMACGSGSLLLRANAETQRSKASLFGQEKDSTTASLAKLNMLLHNNVTAEIKVGDTLNNPQFTQNGMLRTFDYCVANPPFSQKDWLSGAKNDQYGRWTEDMLPPDKNGDYAFLSHLIASMKPQTGKGACILPHGVLFRGNAEETIRRNLVKKGVIEGVIGLPANIFFGTGIPAAIIVLNNSRTQEGVFFIDASRGFIKDGNKNRLREQDIRKIVDVYNLRLEIPHYSRFVSFGDIERNEYNLNIPRYIEPLSEEVTEDLDGHLNGGISAGEIEAIPEFAVFPELKDTLLKDFRPGYFALKISPEEVFGVISASGSVVHEREKVLKTLNAWEEHARGIFNGEMHHAKTIVNNLACKMRDFYGDNKTVRQFLIDKYDAFGCFMSCALETLQDDLYSVCTETWEVAREIESVKGKNGKTTSWDGLLIPKILLERRFFPEELTNLQRLKEAAEKAAGEVETFVQECEDMGEDDPLSPIRNDGKIRSDADAKKILKAEKQKAGHDAEAQAIAKYLELRAVLAAANKAVNAADKLLDSKAFAHYPKLTLDEIKELLITDKWFASIRGKVKSRFETILQNFAASVVTLHERYAHTLAELEHAAAKSQNEVHAVLREMGFDWEDV